MTLEPSRTERAGKFSEHFCAARGIEPRNIGLQLLHIGSADVADTRKILELLGYEFPPGCHFDRIDGTRLCGFGHEPIRPA